MSFSPLVSDFPRVFSGRVFLGAVIVPTRCGALLSMIQSTRGQKLIPPPKGRHPFSFFRLILIFRGFPHEY